MCASPRIRPARAGDAPSVARIYTDSWNAGFGHLLGQRHVDEARVQRWRQDLAAPPPMHWWVAEQEGAVIAIAGVGPSRDPVDPAIGELDTLHVAPAYWRRGVGRALMEIALRRLREDRYSDAILWTVSNYERGQRFYEALGWIATDRTRDAGRQLMYRRSLAPTS